MNRWRHFEFVTTFGPLAANQSAMNESKYHRSIAEVLTCRPECDSKPPNDKLKRYWISLTIDSPSEAPRVKSAPLAAEIKMANESNGHQLIAEVLSNRFICISKLPNQKLKRYRIYLTWKIKSHVHFGPLAAHLAVRESWSGHRLIAEMLSNRFMCVSRLPDEKQMK